VRRLQMPRTITGNTQRVILPPGTRSRRMQQTVIACDLVVMATTQETPSRATGYYDLPAASFRSNGK
jgi:hypothetical protein